MANLKITYRFLFGAEERSRDYEVVMEESGRQVAPPAPLNTSAPPAPLNTSAPPAPLNTSAPPAPLNTSAPPAPTGPDAPPVHEPPAWIALENHKCAHCPLSVNQFAACPAAMNLSVVAEGFKNEKSYEKVTVEVVTAERTYRKQLSLQEGLFGLFGLIMATSECPYFTFLRPMARFHLPFSSLKETIVRSTSFYMLRQYFVAKGGGTPDMTLEGFKKAYKDLETVNLGMISRIRAIAKADAEANSIVILDGFAKLLNSQVGKGLPDLEKMFMG